MLQIDGIIFSLQKYGGISVYFRELIKRLSRDKYNYKMSIYDDCLQDIENFQYNLHFNKSKILERYRGCEIIYDAKLFHSTYYRTPLGLEIPSVVTVHDFVYEKYFSYTKRLAHTYQKYNSIKKAKSIICISESTRKDLLEYVDIRNDQTVYVIPNGVSESFQPLENIIESKEPYILFVGQRRGYKNFDLLVNAMTYLPGVMLYTVGGGHITKSEYAKIPLTVRSRIKHHGFVTESELNKLYNNALCLAYLSAYEGFGIPVVEAMRAGCPVVSINCAAVQEVGKSALTITDPDPISVSNGIINLFDQKARFEKILLGIDISKLYSWEKTYLHTLNVYETILHG